ncbi:18199_t:CDS:1, partial [Cetraspora pellucida]
ILDIHVRILNIIDVGILILLTPEFSTLVDKDHGSAQYFFICHLTDPQNAKQALLTLLGEQILGAKNNLLKMESGA